MAKHPPEIERFIKAINTAQMGPPARSQRDLCAEMGITIGSLSKYLRGEVNPFDARFKVQVALAKVLGHSVDDLLHFYETGYWESELSLDDVTGWIKSMATLEDFNAVMGSMQQGQQRALQQYRTPVPIKETIIEYIWPLEALKELQRDRARCKIHDHFHFISVKQIQQCRTPKRFFV